ncbi:hypothetical protein GCM10023322_42090 [Rugosimonospora acidiphila]|uniref:Uncharacterized protein n=1 Tax=Rugosimonospora acidiphila TaxID=556531 RepID=A0ABP9S0F5_9ACTN
MADSWVAPADASTVDSAAGRDGSSAVWSSPGRRGAGMFAGGSETADREIADSEAAGRDVTGGKAAGRDWAARAGAGVSSVSSVG